MAGEKNFEAQDWGCRVEVVIRSVQWRSSKILSFWAGHSYVGVTAPGEEAGLRDPDQMHCTVRSLPVSPLVFCAWPIGSGIDNSP